MVTNLSPDDPASALSRGSISIHWIDPSTGALRPFLNPTSVDAGEGPFSLAIAPGGEHVYVTNLYSNDVAVFHIDEQSCSDGHEEAASCLVLMEIVEVGSTPADIKLTPDGSHAYVANFDSDSISIFGRDSNSGQLNSKGQMLTGSGPFHLGIDSQGLFLYVAHFKSDTLSQYQIHPNGELMLAQTLAKCSSDIAVNCTGQSPMAVALVDKAGEGQKRFLYVANAGSDDISQYQVESDGTLKSLRPSTVPSGDGPVAMTVDPAGDFLYVSNLRANTISMYRIDQNGQLRPETAVPAGLAPRGLAVFPPAMESSGVLGKNRSVEILADTLTCEYQEKSHQTRTRHSSQAFWQKPHLCR